MTKKHAKFKLPPFMPGLELNRGFYHDVIKTLMAIYFPKLKYAAGLTGNGSDVLGFDTPTSMDHNWGPRMRLFLPEKNYKRTQKEVDKMFRTKLPQTYKGFPVNFTDENEGYLKQQMLYQESGEVNHLIRFYTIQSFYEHFLGFNPYKNPTIQDWLTFTEPALVEVNAGRIYHDTLGLEKYRKKFSYYPKDIWLYLIRIQWGIITNELVFQARTGELGDHIGSRVVAARTVRRIMQMVFYLERRYMPYTKWFGMEFYRMHASKPFQPLLNTILDSRDWMVRQKAITKAHVLLARKYNGIFFPKKPIPIRVENFHGRGYPMVELTPFIKATEGLIKDPKVKKLKYMMGSLDQFIDHAKINHENYFHREMKKVLK
jgi:hypothetical protein